jgi:WD40 repeat protein
MTCLKSIDLEQMSSVQFRPDGAIVAAGGVQSNAVRLFDATRLTSLKSLRPHGASVTMVCFSPDGRILASGSRDQTISLYDAFSGKLLAVLRGHSLAVYALCFDRSGRLLVSGGAGGEIKFWDAATGQCLATVKSSNDSVFGVQLSADSKTLTVWGHGNDVELLDLTRVARCVEGNSEHWRNQSRLIRMHNTLDRLDAAAAEKPLIENPRLPDLQRLN